MGPMSDVSVADFVVTRLLLGTVPELVIDILSINCWCCPEKIFTYG